MRRYARRVVDGKPVIVRVDDARLPEPETGECGNLPGSMEAFLNAFAPGQLSSVELDAMCDPGLERGW